MLRWVMNVARVRIADFAHSRLALAEWAGARSDRPHAGDHEIEAASGPVAVRAVALRGDSRVVR